MAAVPLCLMWMHLLLILHITTRTPVSLTTIMDVAETPVSSLCYVHDSGQTDGCTNLGCTRYTVDYYGTYHTVTYEHNTGASNVHVFEQNK